MRPQLSLVQIQPGITDTDPHPLVMYSTNPDESQQPLYGDKTAGLSGYSHVTGGYAGGQAEYARVVNGESCRNCRTSNGCD